VSTKFFPTRESLVSDILTGDAKIANLFYSVSERSKGDVVFVRVLLILTGLADLLNEKILDCSGILEQSMWARKRVGIGMSYRPAGQHIGWRNRFLGSLKV
jgi:hypothetical protein